MIHWMKSRGRHGVIASLALLGGSQAFAVNYMEATINDSFIRGGNSSTMTHGTNNSLLIKDASTNFSRKSLIQFDLSALGPVPASGGFLQLVISNNDQGGGGTTPQDYDVLLSRLNDGDPGESWSETTVTWNNAPANDTGSNQNWLAANSTPVTTQTILGSPVNSTLLIPLDSATIASINGDSDGLITFLVARDTLPGNGNNLGFYSKDQGVASRAPMLILIPEPSRALLVAAGLGLIMLRRCRS